MTHRTQIAWYGLALLILLAGCGGCRRTTGENVPAGATANSVVDTLPPPPRIDPTAIESVSRADLERLAAAADRYCQAIAQLGGRVSVSVNLSYTDVTDAEMTKLAFPRSTETINLSNTSIGDDSVAGLIRLTGLRSVLLSSTKVTDRSLSYLQQLPRLIAADLKNSGVSSDGYAAFMGVLEARAAEGNPLRIEPNTGWSLDRATVEAARSAAADMDHYADAIAKFGGVVDLQLDFSRLPIRNADISSLAFPRCVRGIDLSYTKITDETLTHLRTLTGLERIALMQTAIGEAGIKELIAMPNLCVANLEGTNISFPSRMELTKAITPHLSDKARRRGR